MARKSRKNVGLIGLGIIGTRVAAGLRSGGYHVFVWNRTPRPAPNFVGSPAEVAEICDIIQIFVADAQAVREVIESFGDELGPRHLIVNCATIGPEATVDIAQLVQARGAAFLDAPFTGSKGAAEKSQLVYYVGGEEDAFLRAKPVLEATSKAIVRCGRVGDAATLKVATNLITAVTTQTLAEALAITRGAGIAPEALSAALEHNACKSGVIDLKLPKMVSGDYEPHFSVKHMFKDVQLGIHIANQQRLEIPLTTVVGGVLYGALCSGWGDLDFSSLYRVYSNPAAPSDAPALENKDAEPEPAKDGPTTAELPALAPGPDLPAGETTEKPAEISLEKTPEVEPEKAAVTADGGPATPDEPAEKSAETIVPEPPAAIAEADKPADEKPEAPSPTPDADAKAGEAPKTIEITDAEVIVEPVKADESDKVTEKTGEEAEAKKDDAKPEGETAKTDAPTADKASTPSEETEEAGLSGFFSRVFRRRGAPAEKVEK